MTHLPYPAARFDGGHPAMTGHGPTPLRQTTSIDAEYPPTQKNHGAQGLGLHAMGFMSWWKYYVFDVATQHGPVPIYVAAPLEQLLNMGLKKSEHLQMCVIATR